MLEHGLRIRSIVQWNRFRTLTVLNTFSLEIFAIYIENQSRVIRFVKRLKNQGGPRDASMN